jgi:peptidoglycan/xylan/chitin deacetylase (PgdA/CDA1 family)
MKKYFPNGLVALLFLASASMILSCGLSFSSPDRNASVEADFNAGPISPGMGDLDFEDLGAESDVSPPPESEAPRGFAASSARVLILMYHHLINTGSPGEYDRTVKNFRSDLTYLRNQNIAVISFDDLLAIQAGTMEAPAKRLAILSFDDGYMSMYKLAFPILKEFGYKATFFLITSYTAHPADNLGPDGKPLFLRWREVAEMSGYRHPSTGERLFTMGSHTVDHPFLENRASSFATRTEYLQWLNKELNQSRNAIQNNVSQGAMFLALPYGNGYGNADIIASAKRFGYKAIRSSEYGSFTASEADNFKLKSLPILGNTKLAEIGAAFSY